MRGRLAIPIKTTWLTLRDNDSMPLRGKSDFGPRLIYLSGSSFNLDKAVYSVDGLPTLVSLLIQSQSRATF
jgi:hypothetical protein